jgi:predicted Fe-Mo cluster-binding NifX family protein
MRIAVPIVEGKLSPHFGHCHEFEFFDVDADARAITKREKVPAPEHQPGLLPRWLAEQGATLVIAGGIGSRAQSLFTQHGIDVLVGAPMDEPGAIVEQYLAGTLQTGGNVCDH